MLSDSYEQEAKGAAASLRYDQSTYEFHGQGTPEERAIKDGFAALTFAVLDLAEAIREQHQQQ